MDPAAARGYGRPMAEEEQPERASADAAAGEEEEEEQTSTPFDHPFFLPLLLIAFSLWFFYDGWFNPDMEWVKFNRYGFAILSVAAVYYTIRALRERRSWLCPACGERNPGNLDRCGKCDTGMRPAS